MDITLPVRRELVGRPEIVDMVGSGGEWPGPWVWRWFPGAKVDGTSQRAIVISAPRPWASPNRHNTAMFPLVQVDCYAGPSRDPSGRIIKTDAEGRALALATAVRRVLHVPQGGEIEWGGQRIVSSVAEQDPTVLRLEGSDVVRARQGFAVAVG